MSNEPENEELILIEEEQTPAEPPKKVRKPLSLKQLSNLKLGREKRIANSIEKQSKTKSKPKLDKIVEEPVTPKPSPEPVVKVKKERRQKVVYVSDSSGSEEEPEIVYKKKPRSKPAPEQPISPHPPIRRLRRV
jgi:hypothetical protein